MAATLHDVARVAGVSIRTVTNVLNGQVRVSESSKRRVFSAIERLDYRPNLAARKLRMGKSGIVALIVPDLSAPYFSRLASTVVEEGNNEGLQVIVQQGALEQNVGTASRERMPLADIILFASDASSEDIDRFAQSPTMRHLVLLGEYDSEDRFSQVSIDNYAVGFDSTNALLQRGCQKIAVIGAEAESKYLTPRRRTEGYEHALASATGVSRPTIAKAVFGHSRSKGYQLAQELFDEHPDVDGLICYSDTLAIGVLAALRDREISVPEDVQVIGIDDIEEGRFSTPTLTSISFDVSTLVRAGLEVGMSTQGIKNVVVPHRLIARESTFAVPSFD